MRRRVDLAAILPSQSPGQRHRRPRQSKTLAGATRFAMEHGFLGEPAEN
jgi:hypothetical protein